MRYSHLFLREVAPTQAYCTPMLFQLVRQVNVEASRSAVVDLARFSMGLLPLDHTTTTLPGCKYGFGQCIIMRCWLKV